MPTNWVLTDDDDDDNDYGDQGQQQQPQIPRDLRRQLQKLAKENAQYKQQLDEMQAKARSTTVADVIRANGYDPKIAGLYPSSLGASEEDVVKWLTDHSSVFAKVETQADSGEQQGQPATSAAPPELDPDVAEALGIVTKVVNIGGTPAKPLDVMNQIKSAETPEKLMEILRQGGARF